MTRVSIREAIGRRGELVFSYLYVGQWLGGEEIIIP